MNFVAAILKDPFYRANKLQNVYLSHHEELTLKKSD
jgi:hypothetical protein